MSDAPALPGHHDAHIAKNACALLFACLLCQGVPPGCSRYSISVKKPLGLVLEQNKDTGVITIVEIAPEGNAAKTGLVAVVSSVQAVVCQQHTGTWLAICHSLWVEVVVGADIACAYGRRRRPPLQ